MEGMSAGYLFNWNFCWRKMYRVGCAATMCMSKMIRLPSSCPKKQNNTARDMMWSICRSVQLLLSQGAIPDLVGKKGVAAIHLAVGKETEKNMRCLKLLLQNGADPNVRSSEGLTPLHVAAIWGCYQNLKLLLMNGGNPNIKDNEGNTPVRLAELEDNRRCAQLLQEYVYSCAGTGEEDLPQFKYSVYSDCTDTSCFPDRGYSFTSQSSLISDLGEVPLSSTRRSSFFNRSNINGRTSCKAIRCNRVLDGDTEMQDNPNSGTLHWPSEEASFLSSTRVSTAGPTIPFPKGNDLFADKDVLLSEGAVLNIPTADGQIATAKINLPPRFLSRRANGKSVSFCDVDEYFPVFTSESPKKTAAVEDTQGDGSMSFNLSEYSGFLDPERLATVLPQQGIDVTSPDHVFVFCRESSESRGDDLEKTVISHCASEDDDKKGDEFVNEALRKVKEQPAHPSKPSSSSGGSSSYGSCESDHYASALDISVPPKRLSFSEQTTKRPEGDVPQAQSEPLVDVFELDKPKLTEDNYQRTNVVKARTDPDVITLSEENYLFEDIQADNPPEGKETFTPSPFVTGRTESRLSRCSLRNSTTPESLFRTSCLFEETLPKPVRTRHTTPRSQKNNYSSPRSLCFIPSNSDNGTAPDSLCGDYSATQSSTLGAGSCVRSSQADTLILPKSICSTFAESQTLCDTVILEENHESSMDSYERNLAEVIQALQGQEVGLSEGKDFLTDDVTSTDEATKKANNFPEVACQQQDDVWITGDTSSHTESVSSSSSSSYFSPRKSRESSDLPCTPGTGCTPRYSMSLLSAHRKSQHLANLSYTPGGRPHIENSDEPVEYLYTDTEQGHKLIEAHIPPTANTSHSSNISTTSREETILYDWRSMQTNTADCKENQKPLEGPNDKKANEVKSKLLLETEGMTDKELRRRLIEMGESPGAISRRTRPVYIQRLRRLLHGSNSKPSQHQDEVEQPQTGCGGYSAELNLALRMFKLPDCQDDEQALCKQFDQPDQNRKWREGNIKSSFNYLLLDPRVTKNLPCRSHAMTPQDCFQTFVNGIFYVGKGKRSRPYSHLYEALEYYKGDKTSKKLCSKVQQILQIWNAEQGVISLHCFQNVIPVEAYTREACMVEAIGLKMLTNLKRGDFYGVVSNWQLKKKRELGVHLLYRAMQIFLAEGERQLRPADIRQ
ncbi:ankyrin repeat and LEM domain-containing protein 1 isoform X1 [Hippocampus zosterae]|uniref:ankyrin repeat and LEM domain-containing protein 1 isoform X1 n=1 Tax=Hippocampus zosterae TaxID=109293 RepID=UPI00223D6727|nr:ankyrin repeat and LEM domain-containing protein 1 isoform X1 [Hippocampus zosterae]